MAPTPGADSQPPERGRSCGRERFAKVAALVAAAAVVAVPAPAGGKPSPDPDRVQVRGSEFDLVLSKQKVRPGQVIVQFLNGGEDPHDLLIERVGDDTRFGFGPVGPSEYEDLEAGLRKGSTYVLWCSLSDHREQGMEAVLRTSKRRR